MGSTLYIPGLVGNKAAHERAVITPVPVADSIFPASRLYDGRLDLAFLFGSTTTPYDISVVLDRILGGDFEGTWVNDTPPEWEKNILGGNPTITEENTIVQSGTKAVHYSGDSTDDAANLIQKFSAKAGELLVITGGMRGDGGSNPARARVINRTTGKYLTFPGATWTSTPTILFSETGTSYVTKSMSFFVEDYVTTQKWNHEIELQLEGVNIADLYWDDWFIFPGVDLFAIFGHNINPPWGASIRSTTTEIDTFTIKQTAFYKKIAPDAKREWIIRLTPPVDATNFPPKITELFIGFSSSMPFSTGGKDAIGSRNLVINETWPQVKVQGLHGRLGSFLLADHPSANLPMTFIGTLDALKGFKNNIWIPTRGGDEPVLIIPNSSEPNVYYGNIQEVLPIRDIGGGNFEWNTELEGLPYGLTIE